MAKLTNAGESFVYRFSKSVFRSFTIDYSCNENTMRGAAKSLATPPAAFIINVTGVNEVVVDSISQFNSRHQGNF